MRNDVIWFKREFEFIQPVELFPTVVERLRGVPARLEEKLKGLSSDILTYRDGDGWSIQQQLGHLILVDTLWDYRITDYLEGKDTLYAADLANTRTHQTDHHAVPIGDLLSSFRKSRESLVGRFDKLTIKEAGLTAHHPRLNKPMRMIDHAFFAAEHDDHHLSRMTDLIELARK